MTKVFIFSGTTEGRELSEFLGENEIYSTVFVATEYGEIVMPESPYIKVKKGRLDKSEMTLLFEKERPDFVIDATHPYAVEVTKNIKAACDEAKIRDSYIRVSREIPVTEQLLKEDYPDIDVVVSTEQAIEKIKKIDGNVLLTTGVKTLMQYAMEPSLKNRLVARILPSKESLNLAYDSGIAPHQIVAMEGPFLTNLNEALIEQYNIKVLVTKNSGIKGGFIEKLEAANNKNIKVVVIDPIKIEEGISVDEAKALMLSKIDKIQISSNVTEKRISIIGIGVGTNDTMTVKGIERIQNSDVLIGAKRMLDVGTKLNNRAKTVCEYQADKVCNLVEKSDKCNISILVSGDTGFYSGATKIRNELVKVGYDVEILPGISSISYLASKIGEDYSNASLLSMHGRYTDYERKLLEEKKIFMIVSNVSDVNNIFNELMVKYPNAKGYIGYNFGMEDEFVEKFELCQFQSMENEGLYVVGVDINE